MAILKIARMGHPVLRRPAQPVADPRAPEIAKLIADMTETMVDAQGAGLAAPQVHVPLRLVIFHAPSHRVDSDEETMPLTVLINPVITPLADEQSEGWEGCLSVPGLVGLVPRWHKIHYTAFTPSGERIERDAEGFHARVVQHECDHLDGILYPQRMTDLGQLVFREELRHYRGESGEVQHAPRDE
jgi:peptide deformylase